MKQQRCGGFSYVETMIAVVLLAIIAVPASDAVKNGLDAARIARDKAQELRCMKNDMESMLAQPYQTLWADARGMAQPSYTRPADASCTGREVYITKYQHKYDGTPVFIKFPEEKGKDEEREAVMLYITVKSLDDAGYSFTTLVAR